MADTTRKSGSRRLARERISILFARAAEFYPENPTWSNRCVELARKIGMRHRVRIERPLKRRFCRRCSAYLVPGSNARVRNPSGPCDHHLSCLRTPVSVSCREASTMSKESFQDLKPTHLGGETGYHKCHDR